MDAAGIDIQVLSHCPPGAQAFDPDEAEVRAAGVNNRLYDFIQTKPDRFGGFRDPADAGPGTRSG